MNAEQFRALPSWVSRSELCRVAGLSPNAIRMRVERGRELSESQQKALDAAILSLDLPRSPKVASANADEAPDLFADIGSLPERVQDALARHNDEEPSREACGRLLAELLPLGYSFQWGFDGEPHSLRKIG